MNNWQEFYGPNAGYIAELYERYLQDPASVDEATRAFFTHWRPPSAAPPVAPTPVAPVAPAAPDLNRIVAASNLAQAVRAFGHLGAHLDPLGTPPHGDPALELATYGLTEADLASLPASVVGGPAAEGARNALEAVQALREIYCGTAGYEFDHDHDAAERAWLREAVETGRYCPRCEPVDERQVLRRLTEVEGLERYLQRTYPGQTRFSIEGLDALVPMLDDAVGLAAEEHICEVILAMAHRGRLNVLAHVLGKPYGEILAEFEGVIRSQGVGPAEGSTAGYTGDVKYHLGARKAYREGEYVTVVVTMAPNPSHLEAIDPVAEGMTRATQDVRDDPGPPAFYENAALPILIHGDAAFPGQGVVAETLNMSALAGYQTAGTVHIIANNQLGFTAEPREFRSTLYASDLAKGFEIPVVHVNADDPLACITAMRIAASYRQRFHRDFLIDLVGYRRWGHNEGDDPTLTQPLTYATVAAHPTVRELYAKSLIARGLVTQAEVDAMAQAVADRLQKARAAIAKAERLKLPEADGAVQQVRPRGFETAVPAGTLQRLNEELCRLPDGFTLNPRLARVLQRRCAALGAEGRIDWGHAETLAFAAILADGTPIRLAGQDTARGTFSQRHLVLHDQQTGRVHVPLQSIPSARASFAVYNSPLSENAALGFEYGYSVHAPGALVIWEAQYGDFANGAQVMIDQFVASGQAKWQEQPSLVMLLPHGFEGQGPEHSSARVERFLQLAAEDNIRIANCTTAAQYFHLLRRQAALLQSEPRPLVVLTPKSLLRLPQAAATLSELAEGAFRPVLDDEEGRARADRVTRLVLCSGKVFYDLIGTDARARATDTAVARLELLYPLPADGLAALFAGYPHLEEVVWVQEEPENMGAWLYVAPRLRGLLPERVSLTYVGRQRRASPAEGSAEWHAQEQARIVAAAFQGTVKPQQMIRGVGHAG